MREILFRGAQKVDCAKSLVWYEGSLIIETDGYTGEKEYYIQNENGSYLVIPETVGQYTGLTDKNGKKIFEGDIVKNEYGYIGLIVMKTCRYYIEWQSGNFSNDLYVFADSLEVIGNIHDNPELLKEADDE